MKKIFSKTAFLFAFVTCLIGYSYTEVKAATQFSESEISAYQQNGDIPEWVKFLAPIVAGLLGKLLDILAKRQELKHSKKLKTKENGNK